MSSFLSIDDLRQIFETSENNENNPPKNTYESVPGNDDPAYEDVLDCDANSNVAYTDSLKGPTLESNNLEASEEKDNSAQDSFEEVDEKILGTLLQDTNLSVRAKNCLRRADVVTVFDLLQYNLEELLEIRNCGKGTVDEIQSFIDKLEHGSFEQPVKAEITRETRVQDLDLTVRSKNCLQRNKIETVEQLLDLNRDDLLAMRNMGEKSVDEVWGIISTLNDRDLVVEEDELNESQLRLLDTYLEYHDVLIEDLGLSARAYNCLKRANLNKLSDIIATPQDNLAALKNMGRKTLDEIISLIDSYTESAIHGIKEGDITFGNIQERTITEIQTMLLDIMLRTDDAISAEECSALIKDTSDEKIAHALENLEAEGRIIRTEFGYKLRLPSFLEVAEHLDDPRDKEVLIARLEGKTLDEVGDILNITRERVRQIQKSAVRKVKGLLRSEFEVHRFAEDTYRYFYETYDITRNVWVNELGLNESDYIYLTFMYKNGFKRLEDAAEDQELSVDLRKALRKYADKGFLVIGNRRVKMERNSIENYVLSKIAKDEIPFDDFVLKYNFFVKVVAGIEDDNYLITDSVKRTRENHLAASRKVLWKSGRMLRYYNIDANEYTPLIETISLNEYHDTEISTRKLLLLHPDIMEEYDIRDEYELHNLLKKIAEEYHLKVTFGRTPGIGFGSFDRDAMVYELMSNLAPISQDELAGILAEMTGFQKATVLANWFVSLTPYYHNGVYRIDLPDLPNYHKAWLKDKLTNDFYFIDELKGIYHKTVADYDDKYINSYSLKQMGFIVNSTYVIRNYSSASDYFYHELTDEDIVDITSLQERYGYIGAYQATLYDLRKKYTIIEFEPYNYVSLRRLNELGVGLAEIREFCDLVSEMASDEYFTIRKLREKGLETELDMLGFDDWFLAGLVREDSRFTHMSTGGATNGGQILLRQGYERITRKAFIEYLVNSRGSIDFDEMMDCIENEYGLILDISRDKIETIIEDTDLYYDKIMDKLYADYEIYYEEI